jgi:hypothetical protein
MLDGLENVWKFWFPSFVVLLVDLVCVHASSIIVCLAVFAGLTKALLRLTSLFNRFT